MDGSIELRGVTFTVPAPRTDYHPPGAADTFATTTPASQPASQPVHDHAIDPASEKSLQLFEADLVLIRQNITSLLRGKFSASSITFIQPKLYLTEDLDHDIFNYQLLQDARKQDDLGPSDLPDQLPEVYIRQGSIQFGEVDHGQYIALGTINLSGGLSTMPGHKNIYNYLLRQDATSDKPNQSTPSLSGQFNLNNLAVNAKLDRFTFEGSHRQVLPRKLRLWWDQYEPQGSLPEVEFGYDPVLGMHAVLEVKDASLSLPFSDPTVRMSNVSGKFTVVGQTVAITQLRGKIENIPYEINGQYDGLERNSPFNLAVRITKFNIPQEPRYLLALPQIVQKQFAKFAPSGDFSAMVNIKRTKPDSEVQYDGQVNVENVKGVYEKFKYPLADVHGVLRFNNDEVKIVSLKGNGLAGGSVTITGVVALPREDHTVHILINATDIPIDEHLYGALEEDELDVVNDFFDHKGAQRLQKLGLIQTSEKKEHVLTQIQALTSRRNELSANEPARIAIDDELKTLEKLVQIPVFDLGGKTNIQVELTHAYGPDEPYLTTATIDTSRISALTEAWHYPLKLTGGKLLLAPGLATLQNMQVKGLDGLTAVVTGHIKLPQKSKPGSKSDPDVHFTGSGAPIGPLLINSLPDTQAKWLEQLKINGSLTFLGRVFRTDQKDSTQQDDNAPTSAPAAASVNVHDGDKSHVQTPERPMDFEVHATLDQGSAKPFDGRILLKKIAGKVLISRHAATIESVTTAIDDAPVHLSGTASWQGEKMDMKLAIQAKDVAFDQPVLDLVPSHESGIEAVRKELDLYKPTGTYDADITVHLPDEKEPDYLVRINPHSLAFNHDGQPVTFTKTQGQLRITPASIIIDHLTAQFDKTSQASFNGTVLLGEKPKAVVDIDAKGRRFDPTTMALLPKSISRFVKDIDLSGGYELLNAKLIYQPRNKETVNFKGQARLINAKANLGVPIEDLQGLMHIDTHAMADEEWPVVKVNLEAAKLTAAGRLIEQLKAELHSTSVPGQLLIPKIRGQIYNGQLLGEAEIHMGNDPSFSTQITVQGAAVEAIVEPKKWDTMAARDPLDGSAYATLSASLAMQGKPNTPASRQGRGKIDIRQANLYQTPFALTFLQILSLAMPTAKSFDRAQASYVIDGDIVRFDSIRFETPSLALTGKGTLRFSTQALDLNFVTRNTTSLGLGPLSDLVSTLKDEIVAIHVGGTIEKPVTSVKSFSGITKTWNDLFGQPKAVEKLQAAPESSSTPSN